MNKEEQKTFDALKNGSEETFKKVYEDNRLKFLHFARKYRLSEEESIDIYQDAYIVFYENVTSKKLTTLKSTISTYIFSVGKYMIIDKLKKNKKTVDSELILNVAQDDSISAEALLEDETTLTQEQMLLQKFFKLLGNQCKKVLTLFYYRGFNIEEIMIEGGYNSENVVKSQKSRCLKQLKELIKSNTAA